MFCVHRQFNVMLNCIFLLVGKHMELLCIKCATQMKFKWTIEASKAYKSNEINLHSLKWKHYLTQLYL